MKKKLLALVLSLTLCFGSTMIANAAPIAKQTVYDTSATKAELAAIRKLFNAKEYAQMYPDVAKAYGNNENALWNHFVNHGLAEGRSISRSFNVFAYRDAYKDLKAVLGNDLVSYYLHYCNYGIKENRQLTTIEKATAAGITVTGMNGQVISNPMPAATGSGSRNDNIGADSASTVQETTNNSDNENKGSSSGSDTDNEKPDEVKCQHEYKVTGMIIENDYHTINRKCTKCGDVVNGDSEAHTYSTIKECGSGKHSKVCEVCGAVDSNSLTDHVFHYTYQDGQYHESKCKDCGYSTTEGHQPCDFFNVLDVHNHGKKCTICEGTIAKAEHQFKDGKCTICSFECPHGGQRYDPEAIDNNRHILKTVCATCGQTTAQTIDSCSYNYTSDDAGHCGKCTVCERKTEKENHNYQNGKCSVCGYEHTNHDWDSTNGTCKLCEKICQHNNELNIKSSDAENHTIDYVCTICGHKEEGTPVNHNFGNCTYDEGGSHKRTCICGWVSSENCTEDTYIDDGDFHTIKCSVCKGEIRTESHSFSNGACTKCYHTHSNHDFSNGLCSVCGLQCKHNNVETTAEQISFNSDYHSEKNVCKDCGYEYTRTQPHKFGSCTPYGVDPAGISSTHIKTCSICQYFVTEPCKENRNINEATCYGTKHKIFCSKCGGITTFENHKFGDDGTASSCMYCGVPKENAGGSDNRDDNVIIN